LALHSPSRESTTHTSVYQKRKKQDIPSSFHKKSASPSTINAIAVIPIANTIAVIIALQERETDKTDYWMSTHVKCHVMFG